MRVGRGVLLDGMLGRRVRRGPRRGARYEPSPGGAVAGGGAPPEGGVSVSGVSRGGRPENREEIRVGDYVQWTSGGVDQFVQPRAVKQLNINTVDGEEYARVEGSRTGIPVKELTVVGRPPENMEEEAGPDIEGVAAVFRRINPDPEFVVSGSMAYQLWRDNLKPGDPALGEGIVGPLDRLYKDGYGLGHAHGLAKGSTEIKPGYDAGYEDGKADALAEALEYRAVVSSTGAGYTRPGEIQVIERLSLSERARILGIYHESKDHEVRTWALRLLREGSGDGPKMVEPGFRRLPRQPRHPGET